MNSTNKSSPAARGIPQPFNQQAGHASQIKFGVAQLKTAVFAQSVKQPVAPPVYRPQAKPVVAQAKMAGVAQMKPHPVAPPVYRPQPAPRALQANIANHKQSSSQTLAEIKRPTAPPVYRPQPAPQVLQTKTHARCSEGNKANGDSARKIVAPAVYRPQPVPRVLQRKEAGSKQAGAAMPLHRRDNSPIASAQSFPYGNRGTIQRALEGRFDFHDKVDDDKREKSPGYEGGAASLHHKISQSHLKHLTGRLTLGLLSLDAETKAAAQEFRAQLTLSTHKVTKGGDIITMLNNMPPNLEIGPNAEAILNDPGESFDGSSHEVEVAPVAGAAAVGPPAPPVLVRTLTPRSHELKKIDQMILQDRDFTADDWKAATASLKLALAAHHAQTGGKDILSSPVPDLFVLHQDKGYEKLRPAGEEIKSAAISPSFLKAAEKRYERLQRERLQAQLKDAEGKRDEVLKLLKDVDKYMKRRLVPKKDVEALLDGLPPSIVIFIAGERVELGVKAPLVTSKTKYYAAGSKKPRIDKPDPAKDKQKLEAAIQSLKEFK